MKSTLYNVKREKRLIAITFYAINYKIYTYYPSLHYLQVRKPFAGSTSVSGLLGVVCTKGALMLEI